MIEDWADTSGSATPLFDRAIELYQKLRRYGPRAKTTTSPSWSTCINSMPRKKA